MFVFVSRLSLPFFSRSAAFLLPAYVGRISFPNSSMTAKSSEYLPGEFWPDPEELDEVCGVGVEELAPKIIKRKDSLLKSRSENMNCSINCLPWPGCCALFSISSEKMSVFFA